MNAHSKSNPFLDRITEEDVTEAMAGFLACLIADNAVGIDCGLEADDFDNDLYKTIFRKTVELNEQGLDANPVSLKPFVPKDMKGLEGTPAQYLTQLAIEGTSPRLISKVDANIQIIKTASLARSLRQEGAFATQMAEEGHSLVTLADEIEKLETRLRERRERFASIRHAASAGDAYLKMFEGSISKDGVVGVPICLPEIAKVLSEPVFEAGNLYGLLSSSGEGKSSLTMQIIYHAVISGHPSLFLSYDQSSGQCVRQMIAQVHGIEGRRQRDPKRFLKREEEDKCLDFAMWINRQPLEIIRCQREGVAQLVAYGRRFVKRYANGRTPLIVIDHIGKVKPRDPKLSADRISGDITVELKAFADETSSAVLILNQRNGEGDRRDNPRPISRDLYGGEGARSDYDAVMWLYRPEKYREERAKIAATDQDWKKINRVFGAEEQWKNVAEVGALKVRFGDPNIREELRFEPQYTRYVSQRRRDQEEMPFER